ncbi:serine/threonine protein kinase [Haliangium ochraceum]|uniref:non-specific serine/threonine protein kinase n=1 Tax=Haliangium ochraceum (strain DSM 14365 / JCM 11303 / SMP-2) TaxID=502025 RepID=D0LW42_HALO1|nr:serine/threonine-protein kinase [Haliangium ochraceum]ACY15974.1 serine/threonine protein kinase [Haliangium ochraceum DSM 14365]
MKCPMCDATVDASSRFCGVCGHRFDDTEQSVVQTDTQVMGAQQDPYLGVVLNNRFVIESKVGEGGFGAVYKGKQLGTGRVVALKLLHPEITQDENLEARFRREGLVMCNLRDAHTVTTYDFDQTPDGTLFIAMELLEGRSLHDVFYTEAPLEWRRMLRIVEQMCTSLAEAHSQGIVHRDLKPENIYLETRPSEAEFVKILDFGIAKVMRGDGTQTPQLTAMGQTLGTLEYMSPEQLMGKELDGRSDIYTVGVLIYEMITGRLPFPDAKGPAALITAQLREVPERPSVVNAAGQIPPTVDELVLKMLAKDKAKRFADVNELREAVAELLRSGAWQDGSDVALGALPPSSGSGAGMPAVAPAPPGDMRAVVAPRKARARGPVLGGVWLWVMLGLIALGGLVGAALALQQ